MQRIDSGSCKVVGAGSLVAREQVAQGLRRLLPVRRPAAPPAGADRGWCGWRRCLPWSARRPAAAGRARPAHRRTASAPLPAETAEALISDSPSLGARLTGREAGHRQRLGRRHALGPDSRPRLRRSAGGASAVISTRSPAPIEPSDGITGWTPALSAATSAAKTCGRNAGAADRQHRRAGKHRRPHDLDRQRLADRAAAPFEQAGAGRRWRRRSTEVPRLAPSPVFSP